MDLIDKQSAIDIVSRYAERLDNYIGSPNDSEVYAYARGLLLSIERNINAMPPLWIPVSERLPEKSEKYLVTALDGFNKRTTIVHYLPKSKSWTLTGRRAYWKVTAWMPLPKPYPEEGD